MVALMMLWDMRPGHKGVYVLLVAVLVLIENRAIDKDRRDALQDRHDAIQQFKDVVGRLDSSIAQNKDQFTAVLKKQASLENTENSRERNNEARLDKLSDEDFLAYRRKYRDIDKGLTALARWSASDEFERGQSEMGHELYDVRILHANSPEEKAAAVLAKQQWQQGIIDNREARYKHGFRPQIISVIRKILALSDEDASQTDDVLVNRFGLYSSETESQQVGRLRSLADSLKP